MGPESQPRLCHWLVCDIHMGLHVCFLIYVIGTGLTGLLGGLHETECTAPRTAWAQDQPRVWALSVVLGEPGKSSAPAGRVTGKQLRLEEFRNSHVYIANK